MATAIYMRVSTEKQEEHGVSLQTQKERLHAYCTMKGLSNVKEYLDVGSGRTTDKRINFTRMMEDVENGYISNVVILKLDRLTRSIIDLNKLVNQLNENNCELHSSTENIDTTTASGRMMLNLIGTFAQWESETISERVSVNMESLASQGQWQGKIPYGFKLVDQRLVIIEKEQAILQEAFDLVIKGYSFNAAEEYIENKYNINWGQDFLRRKATNHSTVGDMYRNGKVIKENAFPALISRETHKKLMTILEQRGGPRTAYKDDDLFRRKLICTTCGEILSLRSRMSEKDKRFIYGYGCHHCFRNGRKSPYINESVLEKALIKRLNDSSTRLEFEKEDIKPSDNENKIRQLESTLSSLERQKKRIQTAWLKEMIEDKELVAHQEEIDMKTIETEKELKLLKMNTITITNQEALGLESTLAENYEHMTKEERRLFIQQHIREIHFHRELVEGYKMKYNTTVTDIIFF